MEKNYSERVMEIKNEILDEIRKILRCPKQGWDARFAFNDPFFIHYTEGEVATTDVCHSVEVWTTGDVAFCVSKERSTPSAYQEVIESKMIYGYTVDSFVDILDNLKKQIREEKLSRLREIVKKNGGRIKFDGKFEFNLFDASNDCEVWPCLLESLYIDDASGRVIVDNKFDGGGYTNGEDCLLSEELDSIIAYCEKETFNLTAEQEKAIDEFDAAATKLAKAGVSIIRDNVNDDLYFINGKKVKQFGVNPDVVKGAKEITDIVKNARCIHCFLEAAFYSADGDKIFAEMSD